MGWKDWPYWLKGGIIGVILLLILSLFAVATPKSDMGNVFSWAIILIAFPFMLTYEDSQMLNFILFPIYFFILGAIIGWIVGKIKSKE